MTETTIKPSPALTIDLTATLTSPLHHGAGSSGNTSLLRTHEIVLPDGTHTRVPFVSANSVRHGLRDALAWHTVQHLGIADGSLAKGVVDLLWSGGAVTTTGAQVDLEISRRIDDLYPALGLLGYAAKSDIVAGTLRVSDLEVVARENAWRLPAHLAGLEHAKRGAAAYRTEEFGTRHDIAGSPVDRYVAVVDELVGAPKTTQMIYDVQALKAGTVLYGMLSLTPAATEGQRLALLAGLALWAPDNRIRLGAKAAVGYGQATIDGIDQTAAGDALAQWSGHVAHERAAILTLLIDLAG